MIGASSMTVGLGHHGLLPRSGGPPAWGADPSHWVLFLAVKPERNPPCRHHLSLALAFLASDIGGKTIARRFDLV